MQRLPLAVLRHSSAKGRHYDLMVLDPTAAPAITHRMWAARVALPPRDWARAGRLDLLALPPHREHYLTYQGPISGSRGRVVRIDAGTALARLWTPRRIVLDVRMRGYAGLLDLRRQSDRTWRVRASR